MFGKGVVKVAEVTVAYGIGDLGDGSCGIDQQVLGVANAQVGHILHGRVAGGGLEYRGDVIGAEGQLFSDILQSDGLHVMGVEILSHGIAHVGRFAVDVFLIADAVIGQVLGDGENGHHKVMEIELAGGRIVRKQRKDLNKQLIKKVKLVAGGEHAGSAVRNQTVFPQALNAEIVNGDHIAHVVALFGIELLMVLGAAVIADDITGLGLITDVVNGDVALTAVNEEHFKIIVVVMDGAKVGYGGVLRLANVQKTGLGPGFEDGIVAVFGIMQDHKVVLRIKLAFWL